MLFQFPSEHEATEAVKFKGNVADKEDSSADFLALQARCRPAIVLIRAFLMISPSRAPGRSYQAKYLCVHNDDCETTYICGRSPETRCSMASSVKRRST